MFLFALIAAYHDSLEGRFTASGPYFQGAVDRLTKLGLKDYIDDTGAGTLATRVRKLLIKPFQKAYERAGLRRRATST